MKLSSIIGQPRAVTQLRAALERGRVHHAWLFSGPEGTGKETAARAFAASLLCAAGGDQPVVEACGTCSSCQKLSRGVHPDLVVVLPESEAVARKMLAREDLPRTPSRELKIEQIRSLQTSLSRSPVEGKRRVVLLLGADSLNAAAQNAFLKTLEEPPAGTHLLLVAHAGDALLATTRSRCVRVPFGPLDPSLLAAEIAKAWGIDAEEARLRVSLAGGSWGRALELDGAALADRRRILEAVEAVGSDRLAPALRLAEELAGKGREDAELALEVIALFYRDVALAAEGLPDDVVANRDLLELARTAAARGAADALRRHERAKEARRAIARNAVSRLAIERMLVSFVMPEVAS